ncbi:hypothetical protein BDY19DRAFT_968805 [Irpex rosettiformis]|uniref:Uncharacterized protein n=1 Tax=Irpex rosettiformis TaxID=378272 RepID=A0ACB8TS82_9APHY|nr:hypothetical protein BDY19DRAFT_968805 [Irpex rosettiformis]
MSEPAQTRRCEDCGRFLQLKTVKHNSTSAPPEHWGLRYFICKSRNPRTASRYCDFFHWIDPPPWTPPLDRLSRSSRTMPGQSRCTIDGCSKIRNKMCGTSKCKAHCTRDGGCLVHPLLGDQPAAAPVPMTSLNPSIPPSSSALSYVSVSHAEVQPAQLPSISETHTPSPNIPQSPPIPSTSKSLLTSSPATTHSVQHPSSSSLPIPATPTTSRRVLPAAIPRLSPRKVSHLIDSFDPIFEEEQSILRQKRLVQQEKLNGQLVEKNAITVHCWLKDGSSPTHDCFHSTGTPAKFKFTRDHLRALALIQDSSVLLDLARFRIYCPEEDYWLGAGEDYEVATVPGQHFFVVSLDVRDLQALSPLIIKLTQGNNTKPPHLRKNLPGERSRPKPRPTATYSSRVLEPGPSERFRSPSVDELLGSTSGSRTIAPHPSLGSGPIKRSRSPSAAVLLESGLVKKHKPWTALESGIIELDSSDNEQVLPLGLQGTTISLASDDSSSDESKAEHQSSSPLPDFPFLCPQVPTRRWPSGYWCTELDQGFTQITAAQAKDKECGRTLSLHAAFAKVFPESRYVAATFSENRARWFNAPEDERACALKAGKTDEGKWEVFAMRNPDVKGKARSERKKAKRLVAKSKSTSQSDENMDE